MGEVSRADDPVETAEVAAGTGTEAVAVNRTMGVTLALTGVGALARLMLSKTGVITRSAGVAARSAP